jgi:HlyD family secretion protein
VGRTAWAVVAVVGVAGVVYAWRPKPLPVDMAKVTRGDLVVTVDELAKSRVRDRFVVSAPLAGNLVRIDLRAGDAVAAGTVLARISPMESPLLDPRTRAEAASRSAAAAAGERQAAAAVSRAEIASRHADEDLETARRLVASGSLAHDALTHAELEARLRSEELASARFAAQMARHEAAMAKAALARFSDGVSREGFDVSAPIAGTVLRVVAQSAGPVQPGTPLVELGEPAALEVVTDVLSADAVRIPAAARVTLERWGGRPLAAHVRRVEPSGFTRLSALGVEEQRVPVIVDLDEPREKWAALGDGFRLEAKIVIEDKRDVLRAPIGAFFRHRDGWATYATAEGRAHLVPVQLGAKSDADVEIIQGLAQNDTVIVHAGEKVAEGVKVTAR